MERWIKLSTNFQENALWENPVYARWWITLIFAAAWKDGESQTSTPAPFMLLRGEVFFTFKELQEKFTYYDFNRTKRTPAISTIKRFFALLEKGKMITPITAAPPPNSARAKSLRKLNSDQLRARSAARNCFYIVNYAKYQNVATAQKPTPLCRAKKSSPADTYITRARSCRNNIEYISTTTTRAKEIFLEEPLRDEAGAIQSIQSDKTIKSEKSKETKETPPPPLETAATVAALKLDLLFQKGACRVLGFPMGETFAAWLDEFAAVCAATGKLTHRDKEDTQKHFLSWAALQIRRREALKREAERATDKANYSNSQNYEARQNTNRANPHGRPTTYEERMQHFAARLRYQLNGSGGERGE